MPKHHRKSLRLHGYDYSQGGVYFVTIGAYRFSHKFGRIVDGEMRPNDLGRLVAEEWQKTAIVRTAVHIDLFIVMPNHFHGLIFMLDEPPQKAQPSSRTIQANSLGSIVGQFKSIVTKRSRSLLPPPSMPIWKRNYHDHVVRNEGTLNRIRQYILSNPARWSEDRYYGDWQ